MGDHLPAFGKVTRATRPESGVRPNLSAGTREPARKPSVDPAIFEIARALARQAAREDHERESNS